MLIFFHCPDHLVELNILKKVMEDGGICQRLAEQYRSGSVKQADAAVNSISATINNFNNLVFADNLLEDEVSISTPHCSSIADRFLGQKTFVVQFNFDQSDLDVLKVQGADDAATANRLKAMNDYLIKTQDKSSGSAAALDAAIQAAFVSNLPCFGCIFVLKVKYYLAGIHSNAEGG